MSNKELARQIEIQIKDACPYDTTFLFLAKGCEAVGQETPLAKAIEREMKARFLLWAQSWLQPIADELRNESRSSV